MHAHTGLLPHLNPGVMTAADLTPAAPGVRVDGPDARERQRAAGLRGAPHFGSPDKLPAPRLATLAAAGALAVPFTTGLLIGIGETRRERLESLLALRALHARHGHLQEIIIQNFRAKAGTRMAHAPEPSLQEQLWTLAVTRLIFGAGMSLQAPPNLQPGELTALVRAGVNDWGGVSPVTPDHVNPEAPWPQLQALEHDTRPPGATSPSASRSRRRLQARAGVGGPGAARRGRAARGRPRARAHRWLVRRRRHAGTAALARELAATRRRRERSRRDSSRRSCCARAARRRPERA